jgi:hypothetical protein
MAEVPIGIESLKTLEQLLFGNITTTFLTTLQECTRIEKHKLAVLCAAIYTPLHQ